MPTWVRHVPTREATPPQSLGALLARAHSGAVQIRQHAHIGRGWQETLRPFFDTTVEGRAMLGQIDEYWHRGTIFDLTHPDYLAPLGAGGGTPLVNGASQTGSSLITDGWPAATLVLRRGDYLKVTGLNPILMATADVTSDGSGNATIPIDPDILVGTSPANNAAITLDNILWRAYLASRPEYQTSGPSSLVGALTLTFVEAP